MIVNITLMVLFAIVSSPGASSGWNDHAKHIGQPDPNILQLELCGGLGYFVTLLADAHAKLIALPISNESIASTKIISATEGGTVSTSARLELLRQVCQSPRATKLQRIQAARYVVALCIGSTQH